MRDNGFNLLLVAVFVTATESILVINALSTCPKNKITVKEPHHQCIPCAFCPEGQELSPRRCGSQITEQERLTIKFECKHCKPGHYSDEYDIYPCKECHNCLDNQPVIKKCTNISDTICHKLCNKGYYFENSSLDCEHCSCCCGDSKDVKIEKCISDGEPESNQCSSHRAQECCKATPQSTVASEQPTPNFVVEPLSDAEIAWIVVGILAFVIIIILIGVILIWKCRGRNERNAEKRQDSEKTSRRYTRSESTSTTSLNDVLTKRFSALKRSDDKEVLFHEEWEVHLPENTSESCSGNTLDNLSPNSKQTNGTTGKINSIQQSDITNRINRSNTGYEDSAPGTPTASMARIPNNKSLEVSEVRLPENKLFKLGDLNGLHRERIGKMLDYQPYGVGSTKKLAVMYGMDTYTTEKMLKESNPGEKLLEYINAMSPHTTVYKFCEDLQCIGRNDIVDELCSYLDKVDQELASSYKTEKSNV